MFILIFLNFLSQCSYSNILENQLPQKLQSYLLHISTIITFCLLCGHSNILSRKSFTTKIAIISYPKIPNISIVGKQFFPRNLRKALSECLNKFKDDYHSEQIKWRDKNGNEVTSTLAYIQGSVFKSVPNFCTMHIFLRK